VARIVSPRARCIQEVESDCSSSSINERRRESFLAGGHRTNEEPFLRPAKPGEAGRDKGGKGGTTLGQDTRHISQSLFKCGRSNEEQEEASKMTYWADNIKFIKDIIESKYKKIDDSLTDVREYKWRPSLGNFFPPRYCNRKPSSLRANPLFFRLRHVKLRRWKKEMDKIFLHTFCRPFSHLRRNFPNGAFLK